MVSVGREVFSMRGCELFDVSLSVRRCISIEKKTKWMLLNGLLHL